MGLCSSRSSPVVDAVVNKYPRTFEALWITKDLPKWIQRFAELDTGGKGKVRITSVLYLADATSTPFFEKVFRIMDTTNTSYQDLRGFVFSTWNLCTMDHKSLAVFVYEMYAAEDIRFDAVGMKAITSDIHAGRAAQDSNELQSLRKIIDRMPSGKMLSQIEFVAFSQKYNMFMRPVFRTVDRIRSELFGVRYWMKLEGKRNQAGNKMYRPAYWAQLQARCFAADNQGQDAARNRPR